MLCLPWGEPRPPTSVPMGPGAAPSHRPPGCVCCCLGQSRPFRGPRDCSSSHPLVNPDQGWGLPSPSLRCGAQAEVLTWAELPAQGLGATLGVG